MTGQWNSPPFGAKLLHVTLRDPCSHRLSPKALGGGNHFSCQSASGHWKSSGVWRRWVHPLTWSVLSLGLLALLVPLFSEQDEPPVHRGAAPGQPISGEPMGRDRETLEEPSFEVATRSIGGQRVLLETGSGNPLAVGFARAGRSAIGVSVDGSVRSWLIEDGSPGRTFSLGWHRVAGVAGTGDWSQVVEVGLDNRLRSWDSATGRQIVSQSLVCALRCQAPRPLLVAAEGGSVAALVDNCNNVQIIKFDEMKQLASWPIPIGASASSLALSHDARLLALGVISARPRSNSIEVSETTTGRLVRRLGGDGGVILAIEISADGRRVFSTGRDRTLRVWDLADGHELCRYGRIPGAGVCLAISPDERFAAVGTGHQWHEGEWKIASSYGIQVWNLKKSHVLGQFVTVGPVLAVAISPDGRRLLSAEESGAITLWPMPTVEAE